MTILMWLAIAFGALDIFIFLLYLLERSKVQKLEQSNDSIVAVNTQNKDTVKKILDASSKARKYQSKIDEIKPSLKSKTKWIILILGIITIASCSTGRIIYKTEYIKSDIPKLQLFERPQTPDVESLKSLVEAYEEEITIYNQFRDDYYLE